MNSYLMAIIFLIVSISWLIALQKMLDFFADSNKKLIDIIKEMLDEESEGESE